MWGSRRIVVTLSKSPYFHFIIYFLCLIPAYCLTFKNTYFINIMETYIEENTINMGNFWKTDFVNWSCGSHNFLFLCKLFT